MANSITMRLVESQIKAMDVTVFEVGAYHAGVTDSTHPEPAMLLRTWESGSVIESVGWLRLQNLQGRNIYIRPKGEHPLTLLDDLNAQAIVQMKAEGFDPALVVETSPGNFQAWLNHGEILPKELSSRVARVLSQRFQSDPSSADWRHFGRLAGFTTASRNTRERTACSPS